MKYLDVWIRSELAQQSRKWPNGFWKGTKAVGFAAGRFNIMLKWGLILVAVLLFISTPSLGAVFCPTDQTTGCKEFCPTQAECNAGWQWASPNKPMVLFPVSLVRFADGKLAINQCTLDIEAYPPWSNPRDGQSIQPCGGSYPKSVSLRTWCDVVKSLPLPPECGVLNCVRPSYVGVCGSNVILSSLSIPQYVKETLEVAPTWVKGRQSERLNRVRQWVEMQSKGE